MRIFLLVAISFFSFSLYAKTLVLQQGDLFEGQEYINEHATGRSCMVSVNGVTPINKGLHCYQVSLNISHQDLKLVSALILQSRVTNAHRPEYPALKSCAKTVDGDTSGDEIYSRDTELLVTDIFSGMHKQSGTRFDYMLTLSQQSKSPLRTRVHVMKTFSEKDYDCVGLKRLTAGN